MNGTIPLARSASCSSLAKVKRWHGSGSFVQTGGSGSFTLKEQELVEGSGSAEGRSLAIEAQSVHSHIPRQKGSSE